MTLTVLGYDLIISSYILYWLRVAGNTLYHNQGAHGMDIWSNNDITSSKQLVEYNQFYGNYAGDKFEVRQDFYFGILTIDSMLQGDSLASTCWDVAQLSVITGLIEIMIYSYKCLNEIFVFMCFMYIW